MVGLYDVQRELFISALLISMKLVLCVQFSIVQT